MRRTHPGPSRQGIFEPCSNLESPLYRTSLIRAVVGGVPSRLRPAGFDAAGCQWRAEGWAEAAPRDSDSEMFSAG